MSIILGSEYKYDKQSCKPLKYKRTVKLSTILNQIKSELIKLGIKVKRPLKKKMPICTSLWPRDSVLNIDNTLIMVPLQFLSTRHPEEWKTIPGDRKEFFPSYPENLEGGDVIQDGDLILVGLGRRTNELGVQALKHRTSNKIITVSHSALHLDCCLMILP